jgi:hypothetical protein
VYVKKAKFVAVLFPVLCLALTLVPPGAGAAAVRDAAANTAAIHDEEALVTLYHKSFNNVRHERDIAPCGFQVMTKQIFVIHHAFLGRLKLVPAIHKPYNRMALFLIGSDGTVAFKTDDFFSNRWLQGQAIQTARAVSGVSFRDLNGDGLEDIIVIAACQNDAGIYAGKTYPVADVLFQNERGYYRDPRISDKINRFDMNKTGLAVIDFFREGSSMEFLFSAKTLEELIQGGFRLLETQCFTEHFEKFGVVNVVTGFYQTVGQNYLMVYLVNKDGRILWNFQTMKYYVNYYAVNALSFRDIDGDGNKDFLLIAQYVTHDENGQVVIIKDYDIYYQRAGYFLEDTQFKPSYPCGETDGADQITDKARQYWGWPQ